MNVLKNKTKNFWTFFIDNYRLTFLILVGIIIFGVLSITLIPKESSPEIDIPVVVITTTLPGASSVDVEELVTNEIEKKIEGLDDLDSFTSVSSQGFSQIVAQFNTDSDGREKLSDVRDRVDQARVNLPSDAKDPLVRKISFADRPILTMAVTGPYEASELDVFAKELRDALERIKDVSEVKIVGSPESQIEIVVNQERLSQYGITFNQLSSALAQANTDIPIGSIETAGNVYTIRFEGRLITVEDVKSTAVATKSDIPVFVEDIGEVRESFERSSTITRMSTGEESNPSVTLQLFKISGKGDIISIVEESQNIVEKASQTYLPRDVKIEIVENDAELIKNDLNNLLTSGAFTVFIVLGVLVLFLGWKAAFIASLVVPLTFLITFAIIEPLGYTINFLTLFSLILALGILVDASIVVTESIFEKLQKKQISGLEAAYETIHEFQTPLIAGTLTTIFVFLPMLLMTGIIGKFIESIPITVSIVLSAAFFVSLAIIPMLTSRFVKANTASSMHSAGFIRNGIEKMYEWYERTLDNFLSIKKRGKYLLVSIAILFVISISLPIIGLVKIDMFPQTPADTIYIDIENPVGTPIEITNDQLKDVETKLAEDDRVDSFLVKAGSASNAGSLAVGNNNSNIGSIVVNLDKEKNVDSLKMMSEYEKILPTLVETKITISQLGSGPQQGSPVQVKIKGDSLDDVEATAILVSSFLKNDIGTRNVDTGLKEGGGELSINIDRAKARSFGLSPSQIASILRTTISGSEATVIKSNGDDLSVVIKSEIGVNTGKTGIISRMSVETLQNIPILTSKGSVPLSTFALVSLESSRTNISHIDGDRVITVSADVKEGINVPDIVSKVQSFLSTQSLPLGIDVSYGGDAEDIAESFASLGQAMIIGILLIFGLLIWQFKSFKQSLFVLLTIPFALIGVLPGLVIVRESLSFPGFIGVVALAGIVVNNAIILIDSINNSRSEGLSIQEAVHVSAKSRLQPILLTTITTVAGMIPLAFSDPMWSPLAYSIIFGLLFSTVLTLFVVPVLYNKFVREDL